MLALHAKRFNSNGTFTTQEIGWDGAGHIISSKITTHTLPYNWKAIAVANSTNASTITPTNSTINATTQVDTVKFNAVNKWIQLSATDHTVDVAHMLSALASGEHASSWTLANQTPDFGSSFNILIPSISFITDEAGHVTAYNYGSSLSTVTLPSCSVSDTVANGNVVTGLSVVSANGVFTTSRANIGNLALTDYSSPANTNDTIVASESLNTAISKLVSRISAEEVANANAHTAFAQDISDLDGRIDSLEESVDTENTGLLARVSTLEETIDTEDTGLTDRVEELESQLNNENGIAERLGNVEEVIGDDDTEGLRKRIADIEDDYIISQTLADAIAQAKTALLAELRENYTLSLVAPVIIATYASEGVINFTITHTDGSFTNTLEKHEEGQWNTVTVPAPAEAPYSYTVPHTTEINGNGTYRIKVQRTYNNQMVEGISNTIIIDDLPDLTPPDNPEEPENPEEPIEP